jgi:hypothetical protein
VPTYRIDLSLEKTSSRHFTDAYGVGLLQIYDLGPIALHMLGVHADELFDGRVVQEIFT